LFVFALLLVATAAFAANWNVQVGYGSGGGGFAQQWAVLRFFPENITIVAGDTVTWVLANDGHTVTFAPSVLPIFEDPVNFVVSPTLGPIPFSPPGSPNPFGTVANPVVINNVTGVYSAGALFTIGQNWTAVFPVAGNYFYFCLLHPDMNTYINVLPANSTAPKNQSQYDSETATEQNAIDETTATYSANVKLAPQIQVLSDGSWNVTIDNGYGNYAERFSLNEFGPSYVEVRVGDMINWVLNDFAVGHTIALNGSNYFDWVDFNILPNGTITVPALWYRAYGDNTNWYGQFLSGGLLLPPGTPGGTQSWTVTIGDELATNFQLPQNFTFLCNIHSVIIDGPPREYVGMTGVLRVYPKGTVLTTAPSPTTSSPGPNPSPSVATVPLLSALVGLVALAIVLIN